MNEAGDKALQWVSNNHRQFPSIFACDTIFLGFFDGRVTVWGGAETKTTLLTWYFPKLGKNLPLQRIIDQVFLAIKEL
jgi:hypothetical protein